MRGLVFALLAAVVVASVQGTRYRGPRFINLGITGIITPVYAGYNRDTLSRFGSISGSSLSRTFGSTFLAGGVTGGRSIGLSSVYPYTRRSTTFRTVAPFSGGFQTYNEFGRLPYVPDDGPYDFDGPLSGFGPGRGLGRGDGVDPYPGGPLDGPSTDGFGSLNGDGPLTDDRLYYDDDVLTGSGSFDGIRALRGGQFSGGFFSRRFGSIGYDYEDSLGRSGAGSVYEPYLGLDGSSSLYPNPYDDLDGRFDLGDRFSSSGFSSSSRTGVSGFDGDFPGSVGSPGLDFNLQGGDGLSFNTQFSALEGQGSRGRGTGSAGLAEPLSSPGRYLEYNFNNVGVSGFDGDSAGSVGSPGFD
nr:uncharacterized protein LOC105319237 [Crassostrea gigas]XP_034329509.1 uncharacterized protein LOC105319237 [Crassostrea gigas]XP_034329510.1 uncharacterized protein LOC105319237 [Crassostrea gigas]